MVVGFEGRDQDGRDVPIAASADMGRATSFEVPAGACDCHTHVFLDPESFPFARTRSYTPPVATTADLLALQRKLHFDRVVIVGPTVYGTDMRASLEGLRELGLDRARGVSVYDPEISPAALARLNKEGVRGMRVNLDTLGVTDPAVIARQIEAAAAQARDHDWHIQVYARLELIEAVKETIWASPAPIVFDHFAGASGHAGSEQAGLGTVLEMLRAGIVYVKLSAPYRAAPGDGPDYPSLAPIARAFIDANAERILWGSDWPHPGGPAQPCYTPEQIRPPYPVDDAWTLDLLAHWTADEDVRKLILVDNPARIYDFPR